MWFSRVTDALTGIKQLCTQVLAAQIQTRQAIHQLAASIEKDRERDHAFIMSIITLLADTKTPASQKVTVKGFPDIHEELPVGHPDGYSREELGIYHDPSQTSGQDTSNHPA